MCILGFLFLKVAAIAKIEDGKFTYINGETNATTWPGNRNKPLRVITN